MYNDDSITWETYKVEGNLSVLKTSQTRWGTYMILSMSGVRGRTHLILFDTSMYSNIDNLKGSVFIHADGVVGKTYDSIESAQRAADNDYKNKCREQGDE